MGNAAKTRSIAVDHAMLEDFDARLGAEPADIRRWFAETRLGLGVRLALRAAAEQLTAPRLVPMSRIEHAGHTIAAVMHESLESDGGETRVTLNDVVVWSATYARGDADGRNHAIEGARLYRETLCRALGIPARQVTP